MLLKGIIDCDTINYKKLSMVLEFPYCNFKCDKECGQAVCQNSELALAPSVEIAISDIIEHYLNNPLTEAIVCQGLEPFNSLGELLKFIDAFRTVCNDDIVVYTGYKKEEIYPYLEFFKRYRNIIIKYGRFIPDDEPHYDEILGVNLASDNQYAERIS
jgi:hypothetical protein